MEILLVAFFLKFERGADYADYAELRVYNSNLKMFWKKKRERKNEKSLLAGWMGAFNSCKSTVVCFEFARRGLM